MKICTMTIETPGLLINRMFLVEEGEKQESQINWLRDKLRKQYKAVAVDIRAEVSDIATAPGTIICIGLLRAEDLMPITLTTVKEGKRT